MPSLTFHQVSQDPKLVIAATSLVSYLIFKRYEPSKPVPALLMLGGVPATLAFALQDHFSSVTTAVIIVFAEYWGLLTCFVLAYRASPFHPLARYSGPLLCKLSKGWLMYLTASTGKTYIYIHELHKLYGDVVRIGPNELSIRHKDVCTTVLGPKGLPRGPFYDTRIHDSGVSLDGLRDMALHTVRRRPWARAMNSASTKYYEELIRKTVSDLISGLNERVDRPVDIAEWMSLFGLDFMGRMAFTYDYNNLKEGRDTHGFHEMIVKSLLDLRWISHIPWAIPFLKLVPGASKNWDDMKAAGDKVALHRVNLDSSRPDLFHHLMDEDGHEAVRPKLEVVAVDGTLAIIAGADTIATAMSHVWAFLLRNPACLERLRKEIDAEFSLGDDIDFAKLANMPYLNACLNEALRVLPPVLAGLQRRVEPGTGGKMVGPYFIPEGTQVSPIAYTIHRNPDNFSPLPNVFWPDRWLSQEMYTLPSGETLPADAVHTNRDAFTAFSQGPMACAGKSVALAEMRAVVCSVLQHFDVHVADERCLNAWEDVMVEFFVTKTGRLPVRLVPRE
ncbi:uncharacterized protein PHACADRAFT_264951 [Phanerochaete carnosa HHB-10118-sp]|uniref:Cytochrome P450 n=1 Tax=Phanerochaete carnosa (strain HHB-10118-sp) TaxID=650164 RepID=K5VUV0_PHACS|nr:uncharacterized protein PHACADRAFT_264951 [Phanerochaete carnosa HHB-10118-sp]EKM50334.1 hypothetical protein PHACADRAFT_264951 [Phanerochaete carnosa HHB-10118-sp]